MLRFLFVPVSTPAGAGEYYRGLAFAHGVRRRWPDAQIHFVINRHAGYAGSVPYPATLIDASPTYCSREVRELITRLQPHVAVFIDAGRTEQLRAAKSAGARVIYISSRFKTRWKGFRLARLWATDEHWIAGPQFLEGRLSLRERISLRLAPQSRVGFFDTMFEPVDETAAAARLQTLGTQAGDYLLFCPGGAGRFPGLPFAPPLYLQAAHRVAEHTGATVLAIMGSHSETLPPLSRGQVHLLPSLPNGELMGLLRDARLAVINGGDLLIQALAQRAVCVAAPIAGDQPRRIDACAARGLVHAVALTADALARGALNLLENPSLFAAQKAAVEASGLTNGVPMAIATCERWLQAGA